MNVGFNRYQGALQVHINLALLVTTAVVQLHLGVELQVILISLLHLGSFGYLWIIFHDAASLELQIRVRLVIHSLRAQCCTLAPVVERCVGIIALLLQAHFLFKVLLVFGLLYFASFIINNGYVIHIRVVSEFIIEGVITRFSCMHHACVLRPPLNSRLSLRRARILTLSWGWIKSRVIVGLDPRDESLLVVDVLVPFFLRVVLLLGFPALLLLLLY